MRQLLQDTIKFIVQKAKDENNIIFKDEIYTILSQDFPNATNADYEAYADFILNHLQRYYKKKIRVVIDLDDKVANKSIDQELYDDYNSLERNYINYLLRLPRLSREDEFSLINIYKDESLPYNDRVAARNIVIEKNMYICCYIANRYKTEINQLDLIHEGALGLLTAIEKFDPTRGIRYCTYAVWFIKSRITNFITSDNHMKCPVYLANTISKLKSASEKYYSKNKSLPSIHELTKLTGIRPSQIFCAIAYQKEPIYLDKDDYENAYSAAETISDPHQKSVEDIVDEKYLHDIIRNILEKIPERDRFIIMQHLGINESNKKMTFAEISKIISYHNLKNGKPRPLTKERCRQIEKLVINMIRNSEDAELLKQYWQDSTEV